MHTFLNEIASKPEIRTRVTVRVSNHELPHDLLWKVSGRVFDGLPTQMEQLRRTDAGQMSGFLLLGWRALALGLWVVIKPG
jgi:hypothetical protein